MSSGGSSSSGGRNGRSRGSKRDQGGKPKGRPTPLALGNGRLPSNGGGLSTIPSNGGNGWQVASIVVRAFWPLEELYGICRSLDELTPRPITLTSYTPEDVKQRLLMMIDNNPSRRRLRSSPVFHGAPLVRSGSKRGRECMEEGAETESGVTGRQQRFPVEEVILGVCIEGNFMVPQDYSLQFRREETALIKKALAVLPDSLKVLAVGDLFEGPVPGNRLPSSLEVLHLGYSFRNLGSLKLSSLTNLKILMLGELFNSPLPSLPSSLEELSIVGVFNESIQLPASLRKLHLGLNFDQDILLPERLEELEMAGEFNRPISLPASLRIASFGYAFNQHLELPSGLVKLVVGDDFFQPITLPSSLLELSFGERFNYHVDLPSDLVDVEFGDDFDQAVNFPSSLRRISFGHDFDQAISLNEGLEYLAFGDSFKHPLHLVSSLKVLLFGAEFNESLSFTGNQVLEELELGECYTQPLQLPASLQRLIMDGFHFDHTLNLPEGLRKLHFESKYLHPVRLPPAIRQLSYNAKFPVNFLLPTERVTGIAAVAAADMTRRSRVVAAVVRKDTVVASSTAASGTVEGVEQALAAAKAASSAASAAGDDDCEAVAGGGHAGGMGGPSEAEAEAEEEEEEGGGGGGTAGAAGRKGKAPAKRGGPRAGPTSTPVPAPLACYRYQVEHVREEEFIHDGDWRDEDYNDLLEAYCVAAVFKCHYFEPAISPLQLLEDAPPARESRSGKGTHALAGAAAGAAGGAAPAPSGGGDDEWRNRCQFIWVSASSASTAAAEEGGTAGMGLPHTGETAAAPAGGEQGSSSGGGGGGGGGGKAVAEAKAREGAAPAAPAEEEGGGRGGRAVAEKKAWHPPHPHSRVGPQTNEEDSRETMHVYLEDDPESAVSEVFVHYVGDVLTFDNGDLVKVRVGTEGDQA